MALNRRSWLIRSGPTSITRIMGKKSWMSKNWRNASVQMVVRNPRGPARSSSGRSWMNIRNGVRNADFCSKSPQTTRKATSNSGGPMVPRMTPAEPFVPQPDEDAMPGDRQPSRGLAGELAVPVLVTLVEDGHQRFPPGRRGRLPRACSASAGRPGPARRRRARPPRARCGVLVRRERDQEVVVDRLGRDAHRLEPARERRRVALDPQLELPVFRTDNPETTAAYSLRIIIGRRGWFYDMSVLVWNSHDCTSQPNSSCFHVRSHVGFYWRGALVHFCSSSLDGARFNAAGVRCWNV